MKRIIIFSLIALVAAGSVSAQKKAKKAKTSKQPKIEVAAPAAPDTVSVDRFSYVLGYFNSIGINFSSACKSFISFC